MTNHALQRRKRFLGKVWQAPCSVTSTLFSPAAPETIALRRQLPSGRLRGFQVSALSTATATWLATRCMNCSSSTASGTMRPNQALPPAAARVVSAPGERPHALLSQHRHVPGISRLFVRVAHHKRPCLATPIRKDGLPPKGPSQSARPCEARLPEMCSRSRFRTGSCRIKVRNRTRSRNAAASLNVKQGGRSVAAQSLR